MRVTTLLMRIEPVPAIEIATRQGVASRHVLRTFSVAQPRSAPSLLRSSGQAKLRL